MYINGYKENNKILNSAHNKYNFALISSRTVRLELVEAQGAWLNQQLAYLWCRKVSSYSVCSVLS